MASWITTVSSLLNGTTPGIQNGTVEPSEDVDCQYADSIPGVASVEAVERLSKISYDYTLVHGYTSVAVCVFGILSNSANVVVLTRKNMASSTNTLLLWLAVADLLTMLSCLPFAIHFYIIEYYQTWKPFLATPSYSWICFLLFYASFSIVCHSVAIWITIALAIFRYIYISMPTEGAYYCSQNRAKLVILIIVVLNVVICVPNYFINTYTSGYYSDPSKLKNELNITNSATQKSNVGELDVFDTTTSAINDTNASTSAVVGTLYYSPAARDGTRLAKVVNIVNYWIHAILFKVIPCVMLTTLTLLLIHAMHKAYRKRLKLKYQGRKAESDKHGEQYRTTGMLLAIVILFTLTELPQGILTLMNIFVHCFYEVVYTRLGDLIDIVTLINTSINFVLYCTMSQQFRDTFKAIFCPSRPVRPQWLKLNLITSQKKGRDPLGRGGRGKHENVPSNPKESKDTQTKDRARLLDGSQENGDHENNMMSAKFIDETGHPNDSGHTVAGEDKQQPSKPSSNNISLHADGPSTLV